MLRIARIVKKEDGYYVVSEKGKNLGGPYSTREEAEKRLRQVEYFKHKEAQLGGLTEDNLFQAELSQIYERIKEELQAIKNYDFMIVNSKIPQVVELMKHISDEEREHLEELVNLISEIYPQQLRIRQKVLQEIQEEIMREEKKEKEARKKVCVADSIDKVAGMELKDGWLVPLINGNYGYYEEGVVEDIVIGYDVVIDARTGMRAFEDDIDWKETSRKVGIEVVSLKDLRDNHISNVVLKNGNEAVYYPEYSRRMKVIWDLDAGEYVPIGFIDWDEIESNPDSIIKG